jgi:hypothetical protein
LSILRLPNEFLNLSHLKIIEDFLENYQITVYESIAQGSSLIYPETNILNKEKRKVKFINIIYDNEHFNVITKMTAFLGYNYFCEYCKIKYSNLGQHNCEYLCKSCKRYDYVCIDDKKVKCPDCKIEAKNEICKKLHDSNQCYKLFLCNECNCLKPKHNVHICGDDSKYWPNCKLSVKLDHNCFIPKTSVTYGQEKMC